MCDELARKYSFITVIHQENRGLSVARNVGILEARGEYITLLDSDDSIENDMIEHLFNLIQKYDCTLSICQHNIVFEDSGKIIKTSNRNDDILYSAEQCIEEMLYSRSIDTSAWAKLYHKSLFESIRFPAGKLFEDIGTIYKLFIASNIIACSFSCKYNYFIRKNSITTSKFSSKKLDLIEMTDQMSNDVLNRYPNLYKVVIRRRVYSRFSTLNTMFNIESQYIIERDEIISFIKNNASQVFFDYNAPLRDKVAILLLWISFNMYKYVWIKHKNR